MRLAIERRQSTERTAEHLVVTAHPLDNDDYRQRQTAVAGGTLRGEIHVGSASPLVFRAGDCIRYHSNKNQQWDDEQARQLQTDQCHIHRRHNQDQYRQAQRP